LKLWVSTPKLTARAVGRIVFVERLLTEETAMSNNPRKLGNEPDPDSTDPNDELPGQMDDVEHVEEDGEPLGGNFA
jgi:hypothetical protein